MASLDQESLFSLELIVDQLCLHRSVECRIPAVAFRLLDFPTLLIYHLEPELAATVRSKLLDDQYRPVPAQLNELKDRKTGAFSVRRGKSCLFRVSPNTLISNLSGVPLYVMVVDMFPDTPKLVGSCGTPLNACAVALYNNIVTNGITVPAVQAERKELDLCNLMGTKIGTILLGYRLLSLGAALLSHIPAHNVIHVKPKEEVDHYSYPNIDKVPPSITEACIPAEKSTNAERSHNFVIDKILEKTSTDSQTQIEPPSFGSVSTQTSRLRSYKDERRIIPSVNDAADVITTNVVCPPPLFYNSTTCKKTVCWHQDWSSVWQMANADSSWSDDGTIRVEDQYIDAAEDATYNVDLSDSRVKNKPSPLAQNTKMRRTNLETKMPHSSDNTAEFPVLSALMAEILRFQGINLVLDSREVDSDHLARYRIQKMKKEMKLQKGDPEKVVERRSAHECVNIQSQGKGWMIPKQRSSGPSLRQRPLFAGTTKTQKLRLAKVNKKLLKEIEAKEMQQRNEFRSMRMNSKRQKENVPTDSQQNAGEIDTLKHIDISRATEYADESRESTNRYKCPVPTPRRSIMLVTEHELPDKNLSTVDASYFGTKTFTVGHKKVQSSLLQQSSSSEENLQFTLCPVKDDTETDHSTRHAQSAVTNTTADSNFAGRQVSVHSEPNSINSHDTDAELVNNFGQTVTVLTTMVNRDVLDGNVQVEAPEAGGVLSLEDLGLRKIVDNYSGDSDSDIDDGTRQSNADVSKDKDTERYSAEGDDTEFDTGKGMDPQLLRKVVNQYSDFSEDEQTDLEYEYDFEDTPVRSLKTVSTMNSAASSVLDSAVHRRTGSRDAGTNIKISGHSRPISTMDEQCKD